MRATLLLISWLLTAQWYRVMWWIVSIMSYCSALTPKFQQLAAQLQGGGDTVPTPEPTELPTEYPTEMPTPYPSPYPTPYPTGLPTKVAPTPEPTEGVVPTSPPTQALEPVSPTVIPTEMQMPTPYPSPFPTPAPSSEGASSSGEHHHHPTPEPTEEPVPTPEPSQQPSVVAGTLTQQTNATSASGLTTTAYSIMELLGMVNIESFLLFLFISLVLSLTFCYISFRYCFFTTRKYSALGDVDRDITSTSDGRFDDHFDDPPTSIQTADSDTETGATSKRAKGPTPTRFTGKPATSPSGPSGILKKPAGTTAQTAQKGTAAQKSTSAHKHEPTAGKRKEGVRYTGALADDEEEFNFKDSSGED